MSRVRLLTTFGNLHGWFGGLKVFLLSMESYKNFEKYYKIVNCLVTIFDNVKYSYKNIELLIRFLKFQ